MKTTIFYRKLKSIEIVPFSSLKKLIFVSKNKRLSHVRQFAVHSISGLLS